MRIKSKGIRKMKEQSINWFKFLQQRRNGLKNPVFTVERIKFAGIQDTYVLLVTLLSVKIVFPSIMRKLKNIF